MPQVTSTTKNAKIIVMTLHICTHSVAEYMPYWSNFLHCSLCHCWHKEGRDRNISNFSITLMVCFIFILYRNNSMQC